MILLLVIPIITAIICYMMKRPRRISTVSLAGSCALIFFSVPTVIRSISEPITLMNGMLYMDALSGYIMALVLFLAFVSVIYSIGYLEHELDTGLTDIRGMRRYYALLHLFIFTMLLVTVANNLALMWIAIESTTIVSALLIGLGFYKRELAIEAAWKYIILCTVGLTFALLGIFITYYASTAVIGTPGAMEWTVLKGMAGKLNPSTMKLAFIFILVGYGTKAGLAPVHNWLPDAHSQAPSPISALLSGILLNTSFYGIIRFVSIVEPSAGAEFSHNLLMLFGLISMGIASIFILVQDNYKRLLAYSSIEHMGIISLGVGIGGPVGIYGALLHILNHAVSKPLMFFASGKIQARYGTTRIEDVSGVLSSAPVLGTLTFIGALSLAGAPPFNIFISEFIILKASVDKGLWVVTGLFLFFAVIVFYGMLAGFGKMLFNSRDSAAGDMPGVSHHHSGYSFPEISAIGVMIFMAAMVVLFGFTVPGGIDNILKNCIEILGIS